MSVTIVAQDVAEALAKLGGRPVDPPVYIEWRKEYFDFERKHLAGFVLHIEGESINTYETAEAGIEALKTYLLKHEKWVADGCPPVVKE